MENVGKCIEIGLRPGTGGGWPRDTHSIEVGGPDLTQAIFSLIFLYFPAFFLQFPICS